MSLTLPRISSCLLAAALLAIAPGLASDAEACCPAPRSGEPVVNADQSVIIVWDEAKKVQHFIRRASFKSEADDFGFLIPTPAAPDLQESGDDAFPLLQEVTAPEVIRKPAPSEDGGCTACGGRSKSASESARAAAPSVTVLEEKTVAGFDAVVLEASSADALTGWLKDHGYAFSPEIEAWAKPYVDGGWKITALRVAKDKAAVADAPEKRVTAGSLRMSFKTDRPLFPYREPDSAASAGALGASARLLRIYFVGSARAAGTLDKDNTWSGRAVWAGALDASKKAKLTEILGLPADAGPAEWWLTEFEDNWPYKKAPGDLYFARSGDQSDVRRPPIIEYTRRGDDGAVPTAAWGLALVPLAMRLRRVRRKRLIA